MDRLRSILHEYSYHILLTLIVIAIIATNYQKGTFLTGWDNLQTELYPSLAIKRAFLSAWQEYQSFGLVSGLAHGSDVIRAVFMWLVSFILPMSVQRYFFNALMLWVGAIGMMFFLKKSGLRGTRSVFAFAGATFYMLNLATVQMFSLPLESFSIFFAALPWLVWIFREIVDLQPRYATEAEAAKHPEMKFSTKLFLFCLLNILATPAFYIQTIFIVYMLILAAFSVGLLFSKHLIAHAFRALFAAILIIALNLFWLLPQFYFLQNSRTVVTEAKSNSISTGDLFYLNQEKGTLTNYIKFEGFYMDLFAPKTGYLFAPWNTHNSQVTVHLIQIAILIVIAIGIFGLTRLHPSFLTGLAVTAIALMPATPPFSYVNGFIRSNDTLNQIFRAPFTKFSIPYAFISSFFFAMGLAALVKAGIYIADRIKKSVNAKHGLLHDIKGKAPIEVYREIMLHTHTKHNAKGFTPLLFTENFLQHILRAMQNEDVEPSSGRVPHRDPHVLIPRIVGFIAFILMMFSALPAFRGYFFNPEMRVAIPKEYRQMNEFFKTQDHEKRVALLPDYTFWGWFFTKWGYDGSGFLWYGIEQPIVSRTFDVWSDKSEGYFWEIKAATEAEDVAKFEQVLDKYNIDYLIMDYSLIPVSASIKGLQYDRLEDMLKKSGRIKRVKKWTGLAVYSVDHKDSIKDFVSIRTGMPNIGPAIKLTNDDTAYTRHGNYLTRTDKPYDFYYPYQDITTQTRLPRKQWKITNEKRQFVFTASLEQGLMRDLGNFELQGATESAALTMLSDGGNEIAIQSPIYAEMVKDQLRVSFDKFRINRYVPENAEFVTCGSATGKNETKTNGDRIRMSSKDGGHICFQYVSPSLEQRYGYLVDVKSKNTTGRPLYFYTLDRTKVQSYIEDRLSTGTAQDYYILSPKYQSGVGYNFTFHNTSYSNAPAINELDAVDIYYLPYNDIKNMRFARTSATETPSKQVSTFDAKHIDYWRYNVYLPGKKDLKNGTLILHQSFDKGWIAYKMSPEKDNASGIEKWIRQIAPAKYGTPIGGHVLVNGWANGWQLDDGLASSNIMIIFWPQYLQFAGMGLVLLILITTGTVILVSRLRKKN